MSKSHDKYKKLNKVKRKVITKDTTSSFGPDSLILSGSFRIRKSDIDKLAQSGLVSVQG